MRKFLKNLRRDGNTGFAFIPEGATDGHTEGSITFQEDAPVIQFCNADNTFGIRRCVLDSAASGFYYLGFHRLAYLLSNSKNDQSKEEDPFSYFGMVLKEQLIPAENKAFFWSLLNRKRLREWDTLLSPRKYLLCLVGIRSSDNKTDHAICIVGNWIFDSYFKVALPLSKESLDICASSNDRKTKFTNVTRGYLLTAQKAVVKS